MSVTTSSNKLNCHGGDSACIAMSYLTCEEITGYQYTVAKNAETFKDLSIIYKASTKPISHGPSYCLSVPRGTEGDIDETIDIEEESIKDLKTEQSPRWNFFSEVSQA